MMRELPASMQRIMPDAAAHRPGARAGPLPARAPHTVVQTYARDMGGGKFVVLKEIDAPIKAAGKHWGGLRLILNFVQAGFLQLNQVHSGGAHEPQGRRLASGRDVSPPLS